MRAGKLEVRILEAVGRVYRETGKVVSWIGVSEADWLEALRESGVRWESGVLPNTAWLEASPCRVQLEVVFALKPDELLLLVTHPRTESSVLSLSAAFPE